MISGLGNIHNFDKAILALGSTWKEVIYRVCHHRPLLVVVGMKLGEVIHLSIEIRVHGIGGLPCTFLTPLPLILRI